MKLKKLLAALMALTIVAGASAVPVRPVNDLTLTASALSYDSTEGTYGDMTYVDLGDHIMIKACKKEAEGEIVIPDKIEGIPVTIIGDSAFFACTGLTAVTIPDTVTYIDYEAFFYCTSMKSITILNPDCDIYGSENTFYKKFDEAQKSYCTIYGYENSTAEAYAEKYGYRFGALDEDPDEANSILEYEKYSDHIEITGCDESAEGELVIPDEIKGLPVTSIKNGRLEIVQA